MWAWPSIVPRTVEPGLAPVNGLPLASTSASGYFAHRVASTSVTRRLVFVAKLVIVNPRRAVPPTRHSLARLGVLAVPIFPPPWSVTCCLWRPYRR